MADHENEDDEIEQHLIQKIERAIQSLADREQNPVIREIRGVIEILGEKDNKKVEDWASVRRVNLYQLNNLFTEWQMTKNLQTSKDQDASDENIKKGLKKMKKEIIGDQEASSRGHPAEGGDAAAAVGQPLPSDHQEPKHITFKRHKGDVYRWSSRHGPRKVHGLEHIVLALERDLVMRKVDDSFKVFGITGVAGIGKTTLCQQIFNRELVKKRFCPRIWVCLSKQPKDRNDYRQEVVVRILKRLGIEDEIIENAAADGSEYGLKRLILLLRLQLIGKRYLLVLDDAWYDEKDKFFSNMTQKQQMDENWGPELAYALPKGCGGTIICSSRSEMLLKKMLGKEASLTVLKRQTEAITCEIFQDNVKGYDEDEIFPRHLTDLKKEILKKCDGIPLAATLLAKIARDEIKQTPARDGVSRR